MAFMMECFKSKSVQQLQEYLKERGVIFSNTRKADLVQLCECAAEVRIEVDPDGLLEDRNEVIRDKLTVHDNIILSNPVLQPCSADLSIIPAFSIFDVYNYLLCFDEYDHASLREYYKMEGYTMFKDGHVLAVETVKYDIPEYVALRAQVKPRTNDKDPVSKLGFYRCWIIMKKSEGMSIHSGYCTCKGGMDGCCRHVVAVLFEVLDFIQDFGKTSCTSKSCTWVRRATESDRLAKPVPVSDLDTSVLSSSSFQSPRPKYSPVPEEVPKPNAEGFFRKVQQLYPKACMLTSKFIISQDDSQHSPPLTVSPPFEKMKAFIENHTCIIENCNCANIFLFYNLSYTPDDCEQIEVLTRGQSKNNNWHVMRKGLMTASVFHQVCCSTDLQKTAESLLKGGLNENSLPPAVIFGRRYETKARNMFIKGHRFRHRQCSIEVPGLIQC